MGSRTTTEVYDLTKYPTRTHRGAREELGSIGIPVRLGHDLFLENAPQNVGHLMDTCEKNQVTVLLSVKHHVLPHLFSLFALNGVV